MKNLKSLRLERGYTQEQLGALINVRKSVISKYERGAVQPSQEVLFQLSDLFDVSIDYLLDRTDKKKADTSEDVSAEFLASLSPETQKIYSLIQQLNDLPEQTRREAMNYIRYVIDRSQSQPPEPKGDQ